MSRLNNLLDYFKYLKNPISCLFFKFGLKHKVTVKFREIDGEVTITKKYIIDRIMNCVASLSEYDFIQFINDLESEKEIITVLDGDIQIYNPSKYKLNRIFCEYYADYYSNFNINYRNRTIIDIGANSGDTALFFALNGAEVYAFEPVKEYYEQALKNIELNKKLKENIHMYNYGVSYKKGKLNIKSMDSVSSYRKDNDSYEIQIISINDIINKVKPDLLKMDCEGCEFEIIENCDLSMFNELIFEYHSKIVGKDYTNLIEKLKKEGFEIEISKVLSININDLGIIHAYK